MVGNDGGGWHGRLCGNRDEMKAMLKKDSRSVWPVLLVDNFDALSTGLLNQMIIFIAHKGMLLLLLLLLLLSSWI